MSTWNSVLLSDSLRWASSSLGEVGDFSLGHLKAHSLAHGMVSNELARPWFPASNQKSSLASISSQHPLCSGVTAKEAHAGLVVTGEGKWQMTVPGEPGRDRVESIFPPPPHLRLMSPPNPQ